MENKINFLQENLPKAALKALTPQAIEATPIDDLEDDCIIIRHVPFRIGRESRVVNIDGRLERVERSKRGNSNPNNDLYLIDSGHRLNISREHLLIEKRNEQFFLVDRGSACGTKVEGENVGGDDFGGSVQIKDGDVIAVGAAGTPYVFTFITFEEYEIVLSPNKEE